MFPEKNLVFLKLPEATEFEKNSPSKPFDFHNLESDTVHKIDDLVNKAEKISKNLEIQNGPQPHLKELRERKIFPEGTEWAATGNAEAFFALANTLYQTPATRELFEREELNIVYPASKMHLSPIEMGIQMAEKTNKTKKINFTYTEIDQEAYKNIEELIKIYVANTPGLSNLKVDKLEPANKEDWNAPRLKRMRFDFKASDGRKVEFELSYEYKMAGENYVREEVAQEADLWILHDTDSSAGNHYKGVSNTNIIIRNFRGDGVKKTFAIAEKPTEYKGAEKIHLTLGKTVASQIGFPIGCGENHWDELKKRNEDIALKEISTTASVIEIDGEKLYEIRQLGGEAAINGYASLIIINNGKVFDSLEICEALLKVHNSTKNINLKNELTQLVKNALLMGASGILSPLLNSHPQESMEILFKIGGITMEDIKKENHKSQRQGKVVPSNYKM